MMFFLAPVNLKVVALQGHLFLLTEIFKIQCQWGFTCLSGYKTSRPLLWVQLSIVLNFIQPFGGCLRGVQEVLKICYHCIK
jgi:hypothetical protein